MKKIVTIILYISIVCLGIRISSAQTANPEGGGSIFIVDGIEYEAINFDPNEAILSFADPEGAFTVPSAVTFQGVTYSVVEIESSAFFETLITSITLPATIREIGSFAFESSTVAQVTALGTTPPTLGSFTFDDRSAISLTVPTGSEDAYLSNGWTGFATINGINPNFEVNNITYSINSQANNTVSIIDSSITGVGVTIPTTVTFNNITYTITEIATDAFKDNQLTSVTIPNTVTKIGESTFENNQLTSITIPSLVTTLGRRAFNTNQLASVVFPANLTEMGDRCFENNQLASINIPTGITFLDFRVFHNNNLTSVTIPANIITIDLSVFTGNPITTIDVLATTPPSVTTISFDNENTIDVTVPVGTEAAYQASDWNIFATINGIINFQVGVTFTENNFNYEITSLNPNEVAITGGTNIPNDLIIDANVSNQGSTFTVTSVGVSAFEEGTLTSVQLPNTIRLIDDFAFQNNQIGSLTIPTSVTRIDFRAFRLNQIGGDLVIPNSVTSLGNGAFELNNLASVTISENISAIGNQTFRNNQLTTVTIPANVNSLGNNCFRSNPLTEVIVLNTTPPTINSGSGDSFLNIRGNIALTVPANTELNYLTNGWTGFASINGEDASFFNEFEMNNITYKINNLTPNEVETADTSITGALTIPSTVNDGTENYEVTIIGNSAFRNKQLTSVTMPNSITNISTDAFRDNQLTSVVIPASVTNISTRAFQDNPLSAFITEAVTPPTVNNQSNGNNSFTNRSTIEVFVPTGTAQNYINNGWTGFKSVLGVSKALVLNVYLQGASLNPTTGEENLMRDDLRVAGLLPGISPYGDGLLIFNNTFVNNTTGEDAIVDWVFIELRDAANNAIIVESTSALLQRDGDVVGMDAVSPVQFTSALDHYFITVKHRNHLGVMSANTKELLSVANTLNFSDANNPITFGNNAQTDAGMPASKVGMWSGNVNGDTIVQYQGGTPDTTAILSAALNDPGNFLNFSTFIINGYNNNDVNLSGTTQYEGGAADSPLILQNVLAHPGNFLNFSTFQIQEQLPQN
ncbi:leucine-rich repeat domain-containing protein [Kordia jejudonensis]|uniref:leucine-rich repeat domain-containing protein n=1 Tax=Kordia jejudonensis TaxID=1348245 RepID=UPI00069AA8FE|nr:leucine-rich repeat domain-containing protein [Kordia jejudonensis]